MSGGGDHGGGGHGEEHSLESIVRKGAKDIVTHFQGGAGKDFKDRMDMLKEFYNPNNKIIDVFGATSDRYFHGTGSDQKGAYEAAMGVLYKHAHNDVDVINDLEHLTEMAESYVDAFLVHRMGKEKFDGWVKKMKDNGVSTEEMRKHKGKVFQIYTPGRESVNILDEDVLNDLKGLTRAEIQSRFRNYATRHAQAHTAYLANKAVSSLISEEDITDMAEYAHKTAGDMGHEHRRSTYTRDFQDLVQDIATMHSGGNLQERGYVPKGGKIKAQHGANHGGGGHASH